MSIINKPYEISVWEDELVNDVVSVETESGTEEVPISYYKENKIAIIGSDSIEGLNMAYDPIFNKNKNGEKKLSFSLKYKYYDPVIEAEVINPFVSYLVNERKVKLKYEDEWYDFIIKEHTESKDGYEWTYNAVDAFVNELSKNGYGVTFNTELNNNQGTAVELALKTLEDTDWEVISIDLAPPQVNEPIYMAETKVDLQTYRLDDNTIETIEAGTKIFIFYSYIANQNGKFLQFIKRTEDDVYEVDDNNNIIALNYRLDKDVIYDNGVIKYDGSNIAIIEYGDIYVGAQAYRTIFKQLSTYDPVMGRTVDQYKADEEIVYHYEDYTYTTSDVVVSYLTNADNFNLYKDGSLQGWSKYATSNPSMIPELRLTTYPEVNPEQKLLPLEQLFTLENFIEVKFKNNGLNGSGGSYLFNSGLDDHSYTLNSISQGEDFLLRWRGGKSTTQHGSMIVTNMEAAIGAVVAPYTRELVNDSGNKTSYYQNIVDLDNIVLHFDPAQRPSNNMVNSIITGGQLDEAHENYWYDGVIQAPSTRYIYESDGEQYIYKFVFDEDLSKYVGKYKKYNSDYFMNYYYLTARAQKAVSREVLSNPKTKLGVFFYTTNSNYWYYLQDVQLTRYYEDANGKPVIKGNIPTATATKTDYYYVKPAVDTPSDKVKTYTTMEAMAEALHLTVDDIVPIYNTDEIQFLDSQTAVFYVPQTTENEMIEQFHVRGYALEKVLSIEAAKTNCFDILQTIAETFECWVDLEVDHEENGAIKLNNYGRPFKQVYLRGYSGKDNFAGFKGGINLTSIEREVDSTEIVTKLIVDDAQSEYTDSGIVSIQKASSNVSKEAYIFNFDYYYNQGLIANRLECEADIYEFNEKVREINLDLQEKELLRSNLENSLTHVDSARNVYSTLVDEAETELNIALDDFEVLTGYTYDEYQRAPESKREEILSSELLKIDTVIDRIGEIYTCSTVINNYQGYVTNLDIEHDRLDLELNGTEEYGVTITRYKEPIHDEWVVKVVVSDYVIPFSFDLAGLTFETDVNNRIFEQTTDSVLINNFHFSEDYKLIDEDDIEVSSITANASKVIKLRLVPITMVKGIRRQIEDLIEVKKKLVKEFYKKYSRFIQEGTWNSQDYLSDELYYLDALNLSQVSGHPKVTYNINAIDLSTVEEFESYNFDAGDKTFIEDTEFFGYGAVNMGTAEHPEWVKTPARESVIVSEIEWHLDDPTHNNITIQNYKTRFEDLFQRIQATIQTVQYNEATYAKTSSIIDNNGTLNESILVESLNNTNGRKYQLTSDGSVLIDGDKIYVRDLTNTSQMVKVASEGFSISDDGGLTWNLALSGRGLNTNVVYAGSIDTDKIFIGGRNNPSFRWDSNGLSAFKKLNKAEEGEPAYDFKNFVRFDQYGLYGIDLRKIPNYITDYVAHSLEDVEDNARFAITWNGFFIRNTYAGGGKVSITSANDFQVIDSNNKERIKIGALEWEVDGHRTTIPQPEIRPSLYGMRISNTDGIEVLKTDDNGNITMIGTITALEGDFRGQVHVGNKEATHILIDGGYVDGAGYINTPVIQSTNYEDGAGPGWMIDANGDAVFNNITARGAIKTAVFEYAEIQAVGGIFLFRPSSHIRSAAVDGNNIIVTVDKPELFNSGQWCKVSNYISGTVEPSIVAENNGLAHVYKIQKLGNNIILLNAKPMLTNVGITINDLIGGALIDMGNESRSSNYGIGINSSDNTVDLPARSISLFETVVDSAGAKKVQYDYKAVLGTLPELDYQDIEGSPAKVNPLYHNYMRNTQGIFTDNMYFGNHDQYITFYTGEDNQKYLDIQTATLRVGADGYLQSADFSGPAVGDVYAQRGTKIDLTTGDIYTPQFAVDQTTGIAYFKGTIEAKTGHIGGFTITDSELKTEESFTKIYRNGRGYLINRTSSSDEIYTDIVTIPKAEEFGDYDEYMLVKVGNDYTSVKVNISDQIIGGTRPVYKRIEGEFVQVTYDTKSELCREEELINLFEKVEYDPFNYKKYPYYNNLPIIPYTDGIYISNFTHSLDINPYGTKETLDPPEYRRSTDMSIYTLSSDTEYKQGTTYYEKNEYDADNMYTVFIKSEETADKNPYSLGLYEVRSKRYYTYNLTFETYDELDISPYIDGREQAPSILGWFEKYIKAKAETYDNYTGVIAGGPVTAMNITNAEKANGITEQHSAPNWYLKSDGTARIGDLYLNIDGTLDIPSLATMTVDLGVLERGIIKHDPVGYEGGLWISASEDIDPNNPDHVKKIGAIDYPQNIREHGGIEVGNSTFRLDWRILLGNKFGVTKDGDLFATGAKISNLNVYAGRSSTPRLKIDDDGLYINKVSNGVASTILSVTDSAAAALDTLSSTTGTIGSLTVGNNLLTTNTASGYITIPTLKSSSLEIKDGDTAILSASSNGITLSKDVSAQAISLTTLTASGEVKYYIGGSPYTLNTAGSMGVEISNTNKTLSTNDGLLPTSKAVKEFVENKGYVTSTWISNQGYLTSSNAVTGIRFSSSGSYSTGNITLGSAAKESATGSVTEGSRDLVSSGGVYSAINNLSYQAPLYVVKNTYTFNASEGNTGNTGSIVSYTTSFQQQYRALAIVGYQITGTNTWAPEYGFKVLALYNYSETQFYVWWKAVNQVSPTFDLYVLCTKK